ncbi:MAG: hypothetical protein ACOZB0_11705 [Pseudomonadota bacterium]
MTLLLFQAGCNGHDETGSNGDEGSPPPSTATPSPTAVGTPDGAAVSAVIGIAGGSLATPDGRVSLTIPPNALEQLTTITLQPITNHAHGGQGRAYRLTPEGLQFQMPAKLSFSYTDEELGGTSPQVLGIAFQRADGVWQWAEGPVVDTTARTVTVETHHFSDWSKVWGTQILPHTATVKVADFITLKIVSCFNEVTEAGGKVVLGFECGDAVRPVYDLRQWSVNGARGGNSGVGTITPTDDRPTATYAAPATKPSPTTVAVSARLMPEDVLLVANITVTEPTGAYRGSAQFAGSLASGVYEVLWQKTGETDGVSHYAPSGSVSGTTHVPGCQNKEFAYGISAAGSIDIEDVVMYVYPETHLQRPSQLFFSLVGQGNDIELECPWGNITLDAESLTKINIGERHAAGSCAAAPPTYSDRNTLTGTYACPPFLENASWSFTAQE